MSHADAQYLFVVSLDLGDIPGLLKSVSDDLSDEERFLVADLMPEEVVPTDTVLKARLVKWSDMGDIAIMLASATYEIGSGRKEQSAMNLISPPERERAEFIPFIEMLIEKLNQLQILRSAGRPGILTTREDLEHQEIDEALLLAEHNARINKSRSLDDAPPNTNALKELRRRIRNRRIMVLRHRIADKTLAQMADIVGVTIRTISHDIRWLKDNNFLPEE